MFKNYNVSIENIKEIGYAQAIINDGGTPYGNKTVYAVKKGDERLEGLANVWKDFIDKGTFTLTNKKKDLFKTGGTLTYVVIFNDDTYLSIQRIDEDIIRHGVSNLLVSKEILKEFTDSYSVFTLEDEIS